MPRVDDAQFLGIEGGALLLLTGRPESPGHDLCVVLCHPYGEEKQFSYRVLATLARRLTAVGVSTLRFDSRGYGDSDGVIADATVETHLEDTLAAVKFARREVSGRVVLLGLRFGATIASLVAAREPSLAGLVLWSPIVDGADYAHGLLRRGRFARMLASSDDDLDGAPLEGANDGANDGVEVEGNLLTAAMVEQMSAVDLRRDHAFAGPTLLVGAAGAEPNLEGELAAAIRATGAALAVSPTSDAPYWDDRSFKAWTLPEDLFERSLGWIEQLA